MISASHFSGRSIFVVAIAVCAFWINYQQALAQDVPTGSVVVALPADYPFVLGYRTPVVWPYGASVKRDLPAIFLAREPQFHYAIPRETFRSDEAFHRYYIDNPRQRTRRMAAPSLEDVPLQHRPRYQYPLSLSF